MLLAATLFAGCATHRASSVAVVERDPKGQYEIRLRAVEWCAGGPCTLPQWPHRVYESDWIYTDTTNRLVPADLLTLSHGDEQFRWPQENLRGSVTFSSGHMRVSFQMPYYRDDGSVKYYKQYELNGDYSLNVR